MIRGLLHPSADRLYAGRLVAFADTVLVAFMVLVGSLGIVTVFVSVAAGADLLRDRASRDTTVSWSQYVKRWRQGARRAGLLFVPTLGMTVIVLDVALVPYVPAIPGAVVVLAAFVAAVLLLRAAGAWRPGDGVAAAVRRSVDGLRTDPLGAVMLGAGLVVVLVLASWVPVLAFLAPGMLAQAAAGVEARRSPERAPVTA